MPTRTTIDITLPRPHPAQRLVISQARRWNAVNCGRRWGKSTLGIDRLVVAALPGEPVAYFSPTYKMMVEIWRDLRRTLLPVTARVSAQEHRLELLGGGTVDLWSLDTPDVARGRKYKRVVIDEAAMVAGLGDAWQAVIRPTLADYAGDAWFLSTPKGRNFFATAYGWGQSPEQDQWMSWQMPTASNPYISPDEIEDMRRTMPERIFAQEVLAAILDDAGGIFRKVRASATAQPADGPIGGHEYIIGADWAKTVDWTVFTLLDVTERAVVGIDRFNQIDYAVQTGRLKALADRFSPQAIIAERNSIGEPIIEQLQRMGLPVVPFTTTNASKALAIEALALAFERGEIRIPEDEVLIDELESYESERLPSGMLRYRAPEGRHDDCVMSLALAWHGMGSTIGELDGDLAAALADFRGV